jgi:hypothetical protein
LSIEASNHWRVPRYLTAAMVLMVHAALIVALLMTSRTGRLATSTANSVELLFVAPVDPPKARTVMAKFRRQSASITITLEPPVLESVSFPISQGPASSTNGEGSGVDWAAEARRALQAFEIRNHQPAVNQSVSGGPEEDHWRLHTQHRAGERFKTASGDWIVWLDANCYEIAHAGSGAYAHVAPLTEPICQEHPGTAAR